VSLVLLVLATVASQLFTAARSWLGAAAPDPFVLVAAFAAVWWPRRTRLLAVVLLGWTRALILVEPAGGQVLCAWLTFVFVGVFRDRLMALRKTGYVVGAALTACCWVLGARLVALVPGADPTAGRELMLGALLAIPLAGVAVGLGRPLERAA